MGVLDNFELGLAGIWDSLTGSTTAAEIYADQTSSDPDTQDSLFTSAATAEENGALGQAASNTLGQIGTGLNSLLSNVEIILVAAAVVVGAVVAYKIYKA